eukprot:1154957-Pelagomonas_calceolata.AAC.1
MVESEMSEVEGEHERRTGKRMAVRKASGTRRRGMGVGGARTGKKAGERGSAAGAGTRVAARAAAKVRGEIGKESEAGAERGAGGSKAVVEVGL